MITTYTIYERTTRNNMERNDVKFEALRHGKNEDLKQSTCYTTQSGKVIEAKDSVKDQILVIIIIIISLYPYMSIMGKKGVGTGIK